MIKKTVMIYATMNWKSKKRNTQLNMKDLNH